ATTPGTSSAAELSSDPIRPLATLLPKNPTISASAGNVKSSRNGAVPVTWPTAESCSIGLPTFVIQALCCAARTLLCKLVIQFQESVARQLPAEVDAAAHITDGRSLFDRNFTCGLHYRLAEQFTAKIVLSLPRSKDRRTDGAECYAGIDNFLAGQLQQD